MNRTIVMMCIIGAVFCGACAAMSPPPCPPCIKERCPLPEPQDKLAVADYTARSMYNDDDPNYQGCEWDSQCKDDRLCVGGICVYRKYAKALEAQVLSGYGVPIASDDAGDAAEPLPVALAVPPPSLAQMQCTPDDVVQCQKRCKKGQKLDCFTVGRIHENLPNVERYSEIIFDAYQKACDLKLSPACVTLSRLYFDGRLVDKDEARVFSLNEKACGMKDKYGCANASALTEKGIGTEQDNDVAFGYLASACQYGHADSCAKMENW